MEIRAATPDDADAVRDFYERLDEESRLLRFHSPVPVVRSWMVDAVVCNDHEQREALLAVDAGRVVGIAEWGRELPGATEAHVGIVVDGAYRRTGVASRLMRHLAANGSAHGIEEFAATILSGNRPMLNMIQHVAPERTTRFDGPVIEVRIPLRATA